MNYVIYCLSEKQSCVLMGETFSLELSICFMVVPTVLSKITDIAIDALGDEGAGGYCTIAPVMVFVLAMPFVKDSRMDSVELRKCVVVDITEDQIDNEHEVANSPFTTI